VTDYGAVEGKGRKFILQNDSGTNKFNRKLCAQDLQVLLIF
jgi:hypothetical protein